MSWAQPCFRPKDMVTPLRSGWVQWKRTTTTSHDHLMAQIFLWAEQTALRSKLKPIMIAQSPHPESQTSTHLFATLA